MATLVDSNVWLDVLNQDKVWYGWSSQALITAAENGPLAINPIIYAELSAAFVAIEDLDAHLAKGDIKRLDLPWEAAFLAGRCFSQYRRAGGQKQVTLPDFYVGAHASISEMQLLTRDQRQYRHYFPGLRVIGPR